MSPATIERRRLGMRDDEGQLTLEGLAGGRPAAARARPAATPAAPTPCLPAPAPAPVATTGATLDDVISGAWRQLGAQRVAGCPVCGDQLEARPGHRGGQCRGCGSTLA